MRTMGKLFGKVAIVTGGASGFGLATSRLWAKEGAKVVIVDVSKEGGERAIALLRDEVPNSSLEFIQADVSEDMQKVVKVTLDTFGRLDILFNNAGILGPLGNKTTELPDDKIDQLIDINMKGVFLGTKYAIPAMIASGGGGVILNMGSDSALKGNRGLPVYCATKGAILSFTRAIAMDHVHDGIRCNTISPCVGKTPMHQKLREDHPDMWEGAIGTVPMGRACEPNDVARVALFLVSDDSAFITGENLMVDGGTLAKGL